eukprot:TRINITY_DN915_c0_g1_i12.p3 TRINITY_DN915_c0_g1~~TRINITY_DN915_c0_g1_i12.p3  ORF type:complete len:101 (-),score=18.92 TRINITY_DN915_c0_g1_i12:269-571(-)
MPGWLPNTVGYHGDDGHVYAGGKVVASTSSWNTADVITCSWDDAGVRFLRNGTLAATVPLAAGNAASCPTVGLSSQGECVVVYTPDSTHSGHFGWCHFTR